MPRTKVVKKKPVTKAGKATKEDYENLKQRAFELRNQINEFSLEFDATMEVSLSKLLVTIPTHLKNARLSDLMKNGVNLHNKTVLCNNTNYLEHPTTAKKPKKVLTNSSSHDDGYLTSETSGASSTGRQSRLCKPAPPKSTRVSSRSKTPANRNTQANTYGPVTPKVKPNTPQSLLRRPKQGEMAISLQGSPLFTGIVSETVANINIPLTDGRICSLQPERGLRRSQVPEITPETQLQLQTLRDHLNKFFEGEL